MPSFHEFDVALSPLTPAAAAASRTPTNEAHVNIWLVGAKNVSTGIISDASHINSGVGLSITTSKSVALTNAPAELILGDAAGPWLVNLADLRVTTPGATLFSGVYLF